MSDQELKNRLTKFMETFEGVFEYDWEFTQGMLCDKSDDTYIAKDGTFLSPKVSDESNNWGNRGSLLHEYRQLVEAMKEQGIYHSLAEIS